MLLSLLLPVLPLLVDTARAHPSVHPRVSVSVEYDFIVVGGGAAGLTLAARLSETPSFNVLLLEAGQKPDVAVPWYRTPGRYQQLPHTALDWNFSSIPEPTLNNRSIYYTRGYGLGGSTAVNAMAYDRGSASVFDLWESSGNPGWSWNEVFPFFKKSVNFTAADTDIQYTESDPNAYSKTGGPLKVGYPTHVIPSNDPFVKSLQVINVIAFSEMNDGDNVGSTRKPLTMDPVTNLRSSSYDSFYQQAIGRPNFHVLTGALVEKVLFKDVSGNQTAYGVEYTQTIAGQTVTLNALAKKEVILSAGSLQSPQLMMLSGIGPASTLKPLGIDVLVDNPSVGAHLQDHTYWSINLRVANSSLSVSTEYTNATLLAAYQAQFDADGTGPLATPIGPAFAFAQLTREQLTELNATELLSNRTDQAHLEYLLESNYYPSTPNKYYTPLANESYITYTTALTAPVSRGSVSINSTSAAAPPVIHLNYFAEETDKRIAVQGFHNTRAAIATADFPGGAVEVVPGPSVQTDAEILEFILDTAITIWHASGTAVMLPQAKGGVVDSRLRVYSIKGLRVVDCSIIPIIPDTHIEATAYMIGEKGASLIKEDWGVSQ